MKMLLLCPISEQYLLSSFHVCLHNGYCLPILIQFIHQDCAYIQGKLLFSTFLTRKEGNTGDTGKFFRCCQWKHSNLHRANSVCDRSRGIVNNIYEGVMDGSLNTCCMLKLIFFGKMSLKYPYTCFHVLVVR